MKKCTLISIFILISVTTIFSERLDRVIDDIVIDFSLNYKEAHPDLVYRPNIGIMPFEELSKLAKKNSIGETITAFFENKLAKSLYFALIDDKSRNQLIKEMKFALSGLAETDRIEVGQLEGIDIFLGGTITEADGNFIVLVKAVDVNTGQVIYSSKAKIKKDILVEASKEFMGAYVSPFGIGIDFYYSPYVNIIGEMADIEGQIENPMFFNANISYRISRNLLAWVGGDFYGGAIFTENGSGGIEINGNDMKNLDYTGDLSTFSAQYKKYRTYWQSKIGLGWVFNISKKFNITAGAEFRTGIVFLYQEYRMPHDLTPDNHADDAVAGTTTYANTIVSSDSWLTSIKPLVKLQYFLSPRLAINALYGFNWQFSEKKAGHYIFQDIHIDDTIPLLWNLDPSLDPNGNEHVTDLTGHRLDVGVSLYF